MCCPCTSDSRAMQRFQDTIPHPYTAKEVIYQTLSSFQTKTVIWKGIKKEIVSTSERPVAIKGMRISFTRPNQLVPLFLREILFGQVLTHLKHKNLIGIEDAFIWPDEATSSSSNSSEEFYFIAMILPWATTDMSEICYQYTQQLPNLNPHREDVAKMFISSIVDGCKVLHQLGISHRDLKPANIFIFEEENQNNNDNDDDAPRVVVADYGLSRLLWRPSSEQNDEISNHNNSSSLYYEADRNYWSIINTPDREEYKKILETYQKQDDDEFFFKSATSNDSNKKDEFLISPTPTFLKKLADSNHYCDQRKNPACHGECCPFTDVCGTRFYRAPELLMRDFFYTNKIDSWALGCVFFELVAGGARLFTNNSSSAKAVVMGSETASAGILETVLKTLRVVPSKELVSSICPNGELETDLGVPDVLEDFYKKAEKNSEKQIKVVKPGEFVKYDWDRILQERINYKLKHMDSDEEKNDGAEEGKENDVAAPKLSSSPFFSQDCKNALDSMLQLDPRVRISIQQIGSTEMTKFFSSSSSSSSNSNKSSSSLCLETILKEIYGTDDDEEEFKKKFSKNGQEEMAGERIPFPFKPRWQRVFQMLAGCRDVEDALSLIEDEKIIRKCNRSRCVDDDSKEKDESSSKSSCVIC